MNSSKQIQEAVGGYFKDPTGTAKQVGSDQRGAAENFVLSQENIEQLKEQLPTAIKEVPKFDQLKNHIDITVTNEGLRIELSESTTGTFLESGKAKISEGAEELLIVLAEELEKLPNKLAIEGHTDSKKYAEGSNYGNWELSSDRANAARRLLQEHGIQLDQVTQVRGFADQRLRKKEDPLDPANRRISLIVQYIDKKAPEQTQPAGEGKPGEEGGKAGEPAQKPVEKQGEKSGEKSIERPGEKPPEKNNFFAASDVWRADLALGQIVHCAGGADRTWCASLIVWRVIPRRNDCTARRLCALRLARAAYS